MDSFEIVSMLAIKQSSLLQPVIENDVRVPWSPATALLTVIHSTSPQTRVKLLHNSRGVPGFI